MNNKHRFDGMREKEESAFANKMAPLKSHVPYIRSRSYHSCPLIMQRSYIACHFLPECKRPGTFNIQVDSLQTVCGVWETDGNAKLTSIKSLSIQAFPPETTCLPFVKYFLPAKRSNHHIYHFYTLQHFPSMLSFTIYTLIFHHQLLLRYQRKVTFVSHLLEFTTSFIAVILIFSLCFYLG